MRGRFEDNADTRRFLFGFQQKVAAKKSKSKFPVHWETLLLFVSIAPNERTSYEDAQTACGLTDGQMSAVVTALVKGGLIRRVHQEQDARRLDLELLPKGRSEIGALITSA